MTLLDALQDTQDAETQEVETQEIETEGVEFHPSRNLNTINREGESYIISIICPFSSRDTTTRYSKATRHTAFIPMACCE